jgi:hypothetical protein
MSKKHTIEYVKQSFEAEGYSLVSKEYKDSHAKLISICPNGHEYSVSFTKWLSGRRCLCGRGKQRLTIEFIKKEFEKRGYTLLSKEYKHNEKLKYICPEGHKHEIRWDHFQSGHGCPYCAGRPIITIADVKKSFESEGYTLLSKEYINSYTKLEYICSEGHKYSTAWRFWKKGHRCPECANNIRKTIDFIRSEFEKSGYKVLTENYINHHQKLHTICPEGHDYYVSWSNWQQHGGSCPKCKEWGTSQQELLITDFVKTLCDDIIEHDRTLIKPLELDIIIPDKKIAIEYCGLYWHSELFGKDKKYHLNKLIKCEEKGYRLITIFEDELVFKKDILFSRLKNLLTTYASDTIYARKCKIKEINAEQVGVFCNCNHTQGYGSGAKIKLGAFYKDELVSIMTFSKPSIAKRYRDTTGLVWELHRFCSKINYRIVGIASKLLKHFERNYEWNNIFSYADRRWSDGNVYNQLGFRFSGYVSPSYWYIKGQNRLRKIKDELKDKTEWEIRKSQGLNRIWDCGNIRFDKDNVIN